MALKRITIIGLGLIGGSLARAFRERLGITDIAAVDRSRSSLEQALRDGNISHGFTEPDEYILDSDIIFVCTPVKQTIKYLDVIFNNVKPGCIVTDVGSTKAQIIRHVNNMPSPPCFIGGHPMAGTEKTGYASGFAHLFENAYYILTPSKSSDKASVGVMTDIVKGIGGIPLILDAEEHDRITGGISHVPHIIASALVNMVKDCDSADGKMQMLAAGGFKDITRIASSDPEMWESIISSNKQKIIDIMDAYISFLNKFRNYIVTDNETEIINFFQSAKDYRSLFPSNVKGLIAPSYEIAADVVDKPGIIGEIATLLGSRGINIKNINVSNNREFEHGCLKITLSDSDSENAAFELLKSKGYRIFRSN